MTTKKFRLSGFDATEPETSGQVWILTGESRPYPLHIRAMGADQESRHTWPGDLSLGQLGLSRDGSLATATVNQTGTTSLWTLGVEGGEPQQVKETGRSAIYLPRLSPSGEYLAYLETPGQGYPPRRGAIAQLVILKRAGKQWTEQTAEFECLLSPWDWGQDDSTLVLTRADGSLEMVRRSDGGTDSVIAEQGSHPRFSPDGTALVYAGDADLMVVRGGKSDALGAITNTRGLAWTPDGFGVVLAQELSNWNFAVSHRTLDGGAERELFSRPRLSTLDVLPRKPDWPSDETVG